MVAGGERAKAGLRGTGADLDEVGHPKLLVRLHIADDLRPLRLRGRACRPNVRAGGHAILGQLDAAVARAIAAGAVSRYWRRLGRAPVDVADKSVTV
jgi:hypothetical protein